MKIIVLYLLCLFNLLSPSPFLVKKLAQESFPKIQQHPFLSTVIKIGIVTALQKLVKPEIKKRAIY